MGSKSSKSEQEKEIKLKPQFYGTNYDESFSTSQNTQTEDNTIKSQAKKDFSKKEKKYPYKFEWKGNGKSVLLAGSFLDNWNSIKVMIKNNNTEIFERVVYLSKAKHQFKFIVDNNWICSNQYPTMADERGIINNYIDLTNYFPPESLLKQEQKKKYKLKNLDKKEDYEYNNKDYNTKMPLNSELNMIPPNIIAHYLPIFNLDYQSNQNNIAKKKYLNYKEKNLMTENNTYKKILGFPHEKLMHLCPNLDLLKNDGNDNKGSYIKICTTVRNRHKFLTTVYYRPRKGI